MRKRAMRHVWQPVFAAAPQAYLKDVVPPSAALHE
jgi:hypothetical protein